MAKQHDTLLDHRYEVRSSSPCSVTDASGILLCTADSGRTAEFWGDGRPVSLSADNAVMRSIPVIPAPVHWKTVFWDEPASATGLLHQCIYRAGVLSSLTLHIEDMKSDFICELSFTSGSEPTALEAPDSWRWSGDAVCDGAFVPAPGVRYSLVVFSDGEFIRCIVRGVEL